MAETTTHLDAVADPQPSAGHRTAAADPATDPHARIALAGLHTRAQELGRLANVTIDALADPAAALRTTGPDFAELARETVPRWHFAMLNDHERNDALAVALERVVPPGATVLDIGAGTGLLAMMAVRAGAKHVYSCEANPMMAEVARQVVAEHGFTDSVTVLAKRSTELVVGQDLPDRVDAVISEIVDCGLIGEGLLPSVRHARAELLAPGGVLLPRTARVLGALVQSEAAARLNRVDNAGGFDVSLLNTFATVGHFPVRLHTWPHRVLSEPVELAAFDCESGPLEAGRRSLSVPVHTAGTAHILVAWFELDLGGGVTLRNSPENVSSHWMQAMIPLPTPVEVTPQKPLALELHWSETKFELR
ncbi:50S ribosomal protein L11 methyltransferase [Kitasatospora mediocidica]|uniref:50S ribosomal protein L11 methyltransferase n=1 Tax=Kitasatospora mediocidica TaxID=58352 RepID=UPI000A021C69|nr:50S ribosomal protein L11 methyltransferase [Kitasatospora mediocidica]